MKYGIYEVDSSISAGKMEGPYPADRWKVGLACFAFSGLIISTVAYFEVGTRMPMTVKTKGRTELNVVVAFAAAFLMVGIAEAQVGSTVIKIGPNGKALRLKMDGKHQAWSAPRLLRRTA
jgi:hypothetical protein